MAAEAPRPDVPGAGGARTTVHVRQAIAGDQVSLDWLVARLSPLLLAHARYRLGPLSARYDPEDVVHDAWLVVLPRLGDLRAREDRMTPVLLRFLSTAIVNRVRNLLWDRARRGESAPVLDAPADRSGAVTKAIRAERAAALHTAIAQLEPADREVVLLRGVEQVSAAAAAVALGITVDAVHKRYQRALAHLRRAVPASVFDEVET